MEFDLAVKLALQEAPTRLFRQIAGADAVEWLNVEMPRVDLRRPDLVARLPNGKPFHLELNARNEFMGRRMLDYYSRIWKADGQPPKQHLLYVGRAALNMAGIVDHEDLQYRFPVTDIRDVDAESLLDSDVLEDNVLAVLCRIRDNREAVRRILERIATAPPEKRPTAMEEFLILSDSRPVLRPIVLEEKKHMPIIVDINLREDEIFGPHFEEAVAEGRAEGNIGGRRAMLRRLIERRFRTVPDWAAARLANGSASDLDLWADRILDSPSLEDLFRA